MRAIGVTTFGDPEVLGEVELPDAVAGPGEVLIRVTAAAVNPTDTVLRSGARAEALREVPGPYVPGMDAAGVVEAVGEGTETDLSVGEHVMAVVLPKGTHGAYAELVAVPADSVVRVPQGASDAEAATLPMNGLTARLALDALGLSAGETLAVTGAAGILGGYCVQLGKADGLRVVGDASAQDQGLVSALGADMVVARGPNLAHRIRQLVSQGVDGLVDAAVMNEAAVPAVKDGGAFASVRGWPGNEERGISFHQIWVRQYAREHATLDRLRQHVEDGQLTLRVAKVLPAAEAPEAHRILQTGGTRGRVVLAF